MALTETLRLKNSATTIDTGVWEVVNSASDNFRGIGLAAFSTTNYVGVRTLTTYDLTGSYVFDIITSIRSPQATTSAAYPIFLSKDANNAIYWAIFGEHVAAFKMVGGVATNLLQATYQRGTHKAFRIRESGGTVYWEYSSDHATWNSFTSATVASLFAITALKVEIYTQASVAGATDVIFIDCLNAFYGSVNTIHDNFNDNSVNTSLWQQENGTALVGAETGGQYAFTYASPTLATFEQARLATHLLSSFSDAGNVYDFTGCSISAKVAQVATSALAWINDLYVQNIYNQDYAQWQYVNGTLTAQLQTLTQLYTVATLTYNSAVHVWWKISELNGTFYFYTSSDGINWTLRGSQAHTISVAGTALGIDAYSTSARTGGGQYIVDNINLSPVLLTGSSSVSAVPSVTYFATITMTGSSTASILGAVKTDQSSVDKTYLYKVYDTSDNFLGLWDDVINDFTYDQEINSAGSSIQVDLARNSDSRIQQLQSLLTTSGESITTQDSNALIINYETANSIGPGTSVDVNLRVEVWAFYGEITELSTTSGEIITTAAGESILINFGAVNGVRKFNGYITRYVSRYGGDEYVSVSIASFGAELDNYVLENGTDTTVPYFTTDPGSIVKDALDKFTAAGGRVDYQGSSVALTGTTVSYTFRLNTYLEVIRKALELAPYDWYWYVGLGDDTVYFNARPTTASHTFILGQHVKELNVEYSIEDITNEIRFTGGEVTPDVNLYKKYTDATSIANYRRGLKRISDHRVTDSTTADLIADGELDRNSIPRYRSSITILDEVYEIESIQLGQLVTFRNFGNYIDSLNLQVVAIRYEPDQVTLQLDTLLPSVNKRIEDLKRNLVELDNEQNPASPS